MQATGGNTIIDMLRDVPQVTAFGVSEAQRSGTGGATNIVLGNSINLRGLSPYATLTLLDGHRVPTSGTSGSTVDPDTYPSIMMQKVDIVADGASATYGSDAIAGVANLILRRDVEGVEVSARGGWAADYKEERFGVLAGHNWGSGQISIGYEHTYHSDLNGQNRSYFESDQTGNGGGDYRSVMCNPGNIVVGGVSYAIPPGGVTPANATALLPNTTNRCDVAKYQDILPEVENNNIAMDFDQKITDSISIYGDGTYSWRNFTSAVQQVTAPAQVPTTNAYFVAPPGAVLAPCSPAPGAPNCETVDYFFGNDLGNNAYSLGHAENYEGTLGIDFKLPKAWHLGFDGTAGIDHDQTIQSRELNNGNFAAALASGSPATALNVFGGPNSAGCLGQCFRKPLLCSRRHQQPGGRGQNRRTAVSHVGRRCTRGLRRAVASRYAGLRHQLRRARRRRSHPSAELEPHFRIGIRRSAPAFLRPRQCETGSTEAGTRCGGTLRKLQRLWQHHAPEDRTQLDSAGWIDGTRQLRHLVPRAVAVRIGRTAQRRVRANLLRSPVRPPAPPWATPWAAAT